MDDEEIDLTEAEINMRMQKVQSEYEKYKMTLKEKMKEKKGSVLLTFAIIFAYLVATVVFLKYFFGL